MKRGTPDHPKLIALASKLKIQRAYAAGMLEFLWHFTSRFAPRGDVGKYEDSAIAKAVDWHRSPSALISALVETGWINTSDEHRLIIHDWEDHCDQAVRKYIKRQGGGFVRTCPASMPDKNSLPHPHPEPHPEPSSAKSAGLTLMDGDRGLGAIRKAGWTTLKKLTDEQATAIILLRESEFEESDDPDSPIGIWRRLQWFEEVWGATWTKRDKKEARIAYFGAVKNYTTHEKIISAIDLQSPEFRKREEKYRPLMATWIHHERWNDEAEPDQPTLYGETA